jgi:hypothetical protein
MLMNNSKLDKFVPFSNGSILGCPVLAEINHSKTVLVQYSDGQCM